MKKKRTKGGGKASRPPLTPEKRVANLIRDAARIYGDLLKKSASTPAAGSVAASDLGNTAYQPELTHTYYTAQFQLAAAVDHLRSLEVLLRHGRTLYGSHVLTRACAEAAARSWWLLDPDAGPYLRTARGLTERLFSLREIKKFNRSTGQTQSGNDPIDAVTEDAMRYEIEPVRNRSGVVTAFGERRPTTTELVDALLAGRGFKLGIAVIQAFSAYVHANPSALLEHYERQRDTETGRVIGYWPTPRLDRARLNAGLALTCWEHAFSRLLMTHGWDDQRWLDFRSSLYRHLQDVSRLGHSSPSGVS